MGEGSIHPGYRSHNGYGTILWNLELALRPHNTGPRVLTIMLHPKRLLSCSPSPHIASSNHPCCLPLPTDHPADHRRPQAAGGRPVDHGARVDGDVHGRGRVGPQGGRGHGQRQVRRGQGVSQGEGDRAGWGSAQRHHRRKSTGCGVVCMGVCMCVFLYIIVLFLYYIFVFIFQKITIHTCTNCWDYRKQYCLLLSLINI